MSFETLRLALLVLHFVGLAALIGPALLRSVASWTVVPIMLTGAAIQVATGNGLIAANQLQGMHVIEAKMIIKLALALASLVLLIVAAVRLRKARKRGKHLEARAAERAAAGIGGLALVTAVIWT
ncbi:MAG TPA: hypothetical protein H9830_00180 [Candidatus Agrococcus pullicola]|uniref:Uncharacterized protein n=1 Tax=Candidatus Agrococcus pullicola TaxID=2838429 RepID=A0A9D1YST2_9MICO|nr:hypothetical protein [Candidatus Agrococcus pullicola]